jgi:hypothetical protein
MILASSSSALIMSTGVVVPSRDEAMVKVVLVNFCRLVLMQLNAPITY